MIPNLALLVVSTFLAVVSDAEHTCEREDAWSAFPNLSFGLHYANSMLKDMEKLLESVANTTCHCPERPPQETPKKPLPRDCADIFEENNSSPTGLYRIWPRSRVTNGKCITVLCEMEHDGGGWTVFQRRGDFDSPKDYFYKNWDAYKNGFGDLLKDFWLGLDNIFALSNQRQYTLIVGLRDWNDTSVYATYDNFWIDDENNKYTLRVDGYRGTAGDSLSPHNNRPFTTKDRHNDGNKNCCALMFKGSWWYDNCHTSNLNGMYYRGEHDSYADGVNWKTFRGYHYSLKETGMAIRPKNFKPKPEVTTTSPAPTTSTDSTTYTTPESE